MERHAAVHIAVYEGDPAPTMFSTALKPSEQRALEAWLAENPDLQALVRTASELAEHEPDEDERLSQAAP